MPPGRFRPRRPACPGGWPQSSPGRTRHCLRRLRSCPGWVSEARLSDVAITQWFVLAVLAFPTSPAMNGYGGDAEAQYRYNLFRGNKFAKIN